MRRCGGLARTGRASPSGVFELWDALYGPEVGYLGLFSCLRTDAGAGARHAAHWRGRSPGHHEAPKRRVAAPHQRFFPYPSTAEQAYEWCRDASEAGRDAFYCAHLLTGRRRVKENAAPVRALWAEADGEEGEDLSAAPPPTAIVESSPGHAHLFWRLMRPLEGECAEDLNRRLAAAIGADPSGWDLSQMSRPPGTRNFKYPERPPVRLLFLDCGIHYHPRELELALPELPESPLRSVPSAPVPRTPCAVDLVPLSGRMRRLAREGNDGSYPSRSEADFALAVAMFGKGYAPQEVASVLLDPALGISEKALEQGPSADRYVRRTVDRAHRVALPAAPR